MADGSDLQLSQSVAARGSVVTVALPTDSRGARNRRVELLLVERKLASKTNYKHNNARIVATATVPAGADHIDLEIPTWLPDTYVGETVGWDYEVRVVADSIGPDKRTTIPIAVRGGGPVDVEAPGFVDLRRGTPIVKAAPLGRNPPGGEWFAIAIFGVAGAIATAIGAFGVYIVILIFGLVLLLFAAVLLVITVRAQPLPVDDLIIDVPVAIIHPGQAVEVHLASPIDPRLEIGLEAIEIYIDGGSNGKLGVWRTVIERYQPMTAAVMLISTDPKDPGGYAGEEIALHGS